MIIFANSIPSLNAIVERGYSIMNNIKAPERYLLSYKHLEDDLRISLNSEVTLATFDAHYYAKVWISKGHLRSDDPAQIRKEKANPVPQETVDLVSTSTSSAATEIEDEFEIISMVGSSSSSIQEPPRKIPKLD